MSNIEFEFVGERRESSQSSLFSSRVGIKTTTFVPSTSRDDGGSKQVISVGEKDILEVETDDGAWLLTREQFFALSNLDTQGYELDAAGNRAKSETSTRQLPTTVNIQRGKRGFVSWILKALRIINIDLAGVLVDTVSKKIDASLVFDDQPGLYKLSRDGRMLREPLTAGTEPVLLLVHGTASATLNAFRELIPNAEFSEFQKRPWQTIFDAFDGRVYAFEHATLTIPVANNTLDLLELLPVEDCPPLVVLSHSRGGLVADLLASLHQTVGGGAQSLDLLASPGVRVGERDRAELVQLTKLFAVARARAPSGLPQVIRHVRVACPAAGTSLAGPNTNIYLTIIAKLLGKLPDLPVLGLLFDLVEALFELAAALVKEGLAPGALPGIESMKPDGLLVEYLQSVRSSLGELVVISGDSSGFVDRILLPIFMGPHDYVVDTASMVDGFKYLSYEELPLVGDGVSHTQYFGRTDVQERLIGELQPSINLARLEGEHRSLALRGRVEKQDILDAIDKHCIVFLPGFMGSELSSTGLFGDYDIWVNYIRLILGMGEDLKLDNDDIFVSGVLKEVYEDFILYASQDIHVVPFAYDWRDAIDAPIDELERLLSGRLDESSMPVSLLCHSMGGLVARAWRDRYRGTWQRLVEQGGYMIQGGTPNLGTWQVARIFSGEHELLNKIARYDVPNSIATWQELVAEFPGPAQMSVFDESLLGDSAVDLGEKEGWQALGATSIQPKAGILQQAKLSAEKRKLDEFEVDERIVYLAGCDPKTPVLEKVDGKWVLTNTDKGDGLALWDSAVKGPDYYIDASHGNIFNVSETFDSILDLAFSGTTLGLPTTPVFRASRGKESSPVELKVRERLGLRDPDEPVSSRAQLLSAITHGGSAQRGDAATRFSSRLAVEVVHGNLMLCEPPVMVGHYAGDQIIRAEAALDEHLGYVLSQRWKLGEAHYASEPGDNEVILARRSMTIGPRGAIVVGMGRMGELSQGDLILTVTRGVQSYLQAMTEAGLASRPLSIASLLVGSGSEALKLSEVLEGVIRGVSLANDSLRARDGAGSAVVAKVQFVEWHFDLALEARAVLDQLKEMGGLDIDLKPELSVLEGGMRRLWRKSSDQWWTSLAIEFDERNVEDQNPDLERLVFKVGGSKALGRAGKVTVSRIGIERRLRAIREARSDAAMQSQKTLFEQLIPSNFKHFGAQQRNLMLELDPKVAYIPWELLVDRQSKGAEPLSVAAGMLRRMRPEDSKHHRGKLLADTRRALIVGNPPATHTDYPHLEGAVAEAECVKAIVDFSSQWSSRALIYRKGQGGSESEQQIIDASLTGDFQILHFAAHGAYEEGSENTSGVVVGEEKKEDGSYRTLYLHPRDVSAFRMSPSLVFLNCCHLGSITQWQGLHHLSASLAEEFIKGGAKAVIAASWAIDDADALRFADSFYHAMFNGTPFGEAVSIARRSIYRTNSNTWAAYQCYGDPGFVLPGVRVHRSSRTKNYQHEEEVVIDLQNLESELRAYRSKKTKPKAQLTSRLDRIRDAAEAIRPNSKPARWTDKPKVVYALALAYGELGDWFHAESWLRRAMETDGQHSSIEDILRVRNYLIRLLEQRASELESNSACDSDEYFDQLELACGISESLQSLSVLMPNSAAVYAHIASAWKLVAMMVETLDDLKLPFRNQREGLAKITSAVAYLKKSRHGYEESFRLKLAEEAADAWYPGNNSLLMEGLLRSKSRKKSERLTDDELGLLKATLEAQLKKQTRLAKANVWAMLAEQEYKIGLWVLEGVDRTVSLDKVAEEVIKIIKNYGSVGQLDSVDKQLRCVLKFLSKNKAGEIQDMLTKIRNGV